MPHFIGVISQNLQAELASDLACGLPGYSRELAVLFVSLFLFVYSGCACCLGMLGHTGVWPHFLASGTCTEQNRCHAKFVHDASRLSGV